MPLLRIQKDKGIKQVFVAGEGIADLASVELLPGERQVKMGATGDEHLAAGVSRGSAVSGALARVITHGMVSGVKTAVAVQAGDRLTIATSGTVTPLNSITPEGAISGYIPIAGAGLISGYMASGFLSGLGIISGVVGVPLSGWATITSAPIFSSGSLVGTEFSTGRVLGKALTSGGAGSGIQMLICLE